jgi:phosphoenolpyruvate carboxylase
MRTLERTFAAVALATAHRDQAPAAPADRAAMRTLATSSLKAYRHLAFDNPLFFEYFRAVTPLDVIERMHIGSRPAMRAGGTGLAALRAIPWVFAWTQSRHMLPGWYGFGTGLQTAFEEHGDAGALAILSAFVR